MAILPSSKCPPIFAEFASKSRPIVVVPTKSNKLDSDDFFCQFNESRNEKEESQYFASGSCCMRSTVLTKIR